MAQKTIPTDERIKQQAEVLKSMKPNVRKFSRFGDNNHAAIDAQILVLEKGLDEDAIYDRWSDDESYVRDSALFALAWMDGDDQELPADGWTILQEPAQ